ncbi:MAG TPA: hypothetical protein VHA11_14625, partial [Bryobacteraceae bacterium]|nr:hypothetical protein [Bryobacteraceae bacterium]
MRFESVVRALSRNDFKLALLVGAAVFLLEVAFLAPAPSSIDEDSMLAVSESLVASQSFAVPAYLGAPGPDGQHFSRWYPLLSIVAMPTTAAGHAMAELLDLPGHYVAAVFGMVLSAGISAVCAAVVLLLGLQLGGTARAAVAAGAAFAFGTISVTYSRTFFAEPLLGLLTAIALLGALSTSQTGQRIATAASALCVLAKPAGIVIGPLLSAYLLLRKEPLHRALQPLAASAAGLALYMGYNFHRFEDPLNFGQPTDFGVAGAGQAILGLLVSPGRGLFWYCPVVLALAGLGRLLWKRLEPALIVAVALAYLGLHSLWAQWHGAWCWGPRFLLPALPGLLALTALLTRVAWRRAFVALACAGFLVNAPMLFSSFKQYHAEAHEAGLPLEQFLWNLPDSPLVNAWGAAQRQVAAARATDVKDVVSASGV